MHRFNSITLGLAIALGAAASLASLAWAAPPAGPRPTPGPPPSTCVSAGTAIAGPRLLLLGETTAVTLTVRLVCQADMIHSHVVFVVDPSAAMGRERVHEMQKLLTDVIDRFSGPSKLGYRFGVVVVDEAATTAAQLTDDVGKIKRAFSRIEPRGDTRVELGIEEGLRLIQQARPEGRNTINEVMILFSDGRNATGCRAGERTSRKAKSNGVIVISVCVGRTCDRRCMQPIASSSRYFFTWEDATGVYYILERIAPDLRKITVRHMTVIETLPANMDYVEGSAIPEPSAIATDTRRLTWTQSFVPVDGMTITYQVQPLAAGRHPVSLGARAEFRDSQDRVGSVILPLPYVDVLAPFLVPTATPSVP